MEGNLSVRLPQVSKLSRGPFFTETTALEIDTTVWDVLNKLRSVVEGGVYFMGLTLDKL